MVISLIAAAVIFTLVGYYGGKSLYEAKIDLSPSPTPTLSPSPTVTTTISAVSKTSTEIEKLRQEKSDLQAELDAKNNELSAKQAGLSIITSYNDFLEYMTQVVDAHDGFTGWTDAEYQIAREKAQATGNSTFLSTVETAWNDTTIDVTTRIIKVYRGIISGIKEGLGK